ncbi:MAG: DUF3822 family protein [Bacteroidales bacterium]|nr:DUF3822 family protein [Bacteroidales bacterium]
MSYSIKKLISTPNEVPSYYKRLSICLNPNGFSFSRMTVQGTLLTFGEIDIDLFRPMSELTSDLKAFFASQNISPFDFEDMTLVADSDYTTWIPQELFEPEHERDYMAPLYSLPASMGCGSTFNKAVGAYCVFAASTSVVTAFRIAMPGIEVVCQQSLLANQQVLQMADKAPVILLHQREGQCDFVIASNGRLLLSNNYAVHTNEERLYRTLELMKSLQVESDQLALLLCGNVDRDTYASMRGYFPHINLYSGSQIRFINPEFKQLPIYKHILSLL